MTQIQRSLPQPNGRMFLTDGGLETTMVFHKGLALPHFAAFTLLRSDSGREALRSYFLPYLKTAQQSGLGFVLDTPTWRANADWGTKLGYGSDDLLDIQTASARFAQDLRTAFMTPSNPILVNGVVGPRGDGYKADARMSADEAQGYHRAQIEAFRDNGADMVSAITMTYPEEAIGIVKAAKARDLPVVISFTVETDGRLPSGIPLGAAIEGVDAVSNSGPAYYMINCAHPQHFEHLFARAEPWHARIGGLRANASTLSHEELDNATELDSGDPIRLADDYRRLRPRLPSLCVLGGCCGTDHRHIAAICEACAPEVDKIVRLRRR